MAEEGTERRLAAIMSADVAGYSRLMGKDEAGTLAALKALRKDVFAPQVTAHKGRVVKLMGDGALVEFPSIVNAVDCAIAVQRALAVRASGEQIELRIGINLGDIIIEGSDIYGDGVNVAARIQEVAEPGGVALSAVAHDQVAGKVEAAFEDAGEHELKNIDKPVRVYRWTDDPTGASTASSSEPLLLPDKPSIAVLPFTNMSGDPEQEYFADGISEEIITALSKIDKLFVVARNSTFTYKGQAVDVKQVGREQGVRYVLEGSVRRGGNRLRITAQLIDATTGNHLWAERYDRESSDVFALQDEITREVTSALQVKLTEGEQARMWASGTQSLEAWEFATQAVALGESHRREDAHEARRLLEQALRIDENYAAAWAMLGTAIWQFAIHPEWGASREESLDLALAASDRALAIDPSNPDTLANRALILQSLGRDDEALALSQKAVALAPNHSRAVALAAVVASYCGEPRDVVELVAKAIRLCPIYPAWYLTQLSRAYWIMERMDDAIDAANAAIERDPDFTYAHILLAIVFADMGRDAEARRAAAEALRVEPKFSVSAWLEHRRYDSKLLIREADALRKAGLPG